MVHAAIICQCARAWRISLITSGAPAMRRDLADQARLRDPVNRNQISTYGWKRASLCHVYQHRSWSFATSALSFALRVVFVHANNSDRWPNNHGRGIRRDACARATPPSTPVTLTDRDQGKKPAQISVGQTIAVRLPSKRRPDISGASLAFITSDYATDPQAAGRGGTGGTRTLQFTTKSAGRGKLKLGTHVPGRRRCPRQRPSR